MFASGCRSAEKSGAGAGGGSGSNAGIDGYDMSPGTGSLSCGWSSDALDVLGMSANAEAKSAAVGLVRRSVAMDVRA